MLNVKKQQSHSVGPENTEPLRQMLPNVQKSLTLLLQDVLHHPCLRMMAVVVTVRRRKREREVEGKQKLTMGYIAQRDIVMIMITVGHGVPQMYHNESYVDETKQILLTPVDLN